MLQNVFSVFGIAWQQHLFLYLTREEKNISYNSVHSSLGCWNRKSSGIKCDAVLSLSYIGFLCYKNKAHTHTVLHVHAQHKVNHSINDFLLASTASCYLRVHARRRYAAAAQMNYFNRTSHLYSYSLKFTLLEKVKLKNEYMTHMYCVCLISVSLSSKWCPNFCITFSQILMLFALSTTLPL